MSRAFVREHDGSEVPEDFPERPVSPHANFVTARGLEQIEAQLRAIETERAAAKAADDRIELARIERDLRYWQQRKASARLVTPDATPDRVRFGVRVDLREADGAQRSFTLVGEDEADPAAGLISWISPLAQALLGKEVGDEVPVAGRPAEIVALH
jgi:transcription elongation GreA/GreB family factor